MKKKLFNFFKEHSIELMYDLYIGETQEILDENGEMSEEEFEAIFDETLKIFAEQVKKLKMPD